MKKFHTVLIEVPNSNLENVLGHTSHKSVTDVLNAWGKKGYRPLAPDGDSHWFVMKEYEDD